MALTGRRIIALAARRPTLLPSQSLSLSIQRALLLRPTSTDAPSSSPSHRDAPTSIKIQSRTPDQGQGLLAQQRLRRPVAPHLSIYKFQVHSVSSAMERNTGLLFSGPLYLFATSYLFAPYLGWDLSSDAVVAAVAGLPVAVKVGLKFALAWPFTFHVINGVRYVVTAFGTQTLRSREQAVRIAWGVVGVSFVSAVGVVAYY
ncbi:hypothetical protein BJX70DRAFT_381763 [Aspergillus crustosus]